MEQKFTIWERVKSDTPSFFVRMQILGLSLASLGTSLTQISGIPAKICTILISAGSTLALVGQFAVKQYQPLDNYTNDKTKQKRDRSDQKF